MRSRLLRFCLLALAAFAVMPGTAMALNTAGSSTADVNSRLCWTGQPCRVCYPAGTFEICVIDESISG